MREYRPLRDIIFGVGKREGRGEEGGGGEKERKEKKERKQSRRRIERYL